MENASEGPGFESCILLHTVLTSLIRNFLSSKQKKKKIRHDKHILKYKWGSLCKALGTYVMVTADKFDKMKDNDNDREKNEKIHWVKILQGRRRRLEREMLKYAKGKHRLTKSNCP